jgi:hypothetical protein
MLAGGPTGSNCEGAADAKLRKTPPPTERSLAEANAAPSFVVPVRTYPQAVRVAARAQAGDDDVVHTRQSIAAS